MAMRLSREYQGTWADSHNMQLADTLMLETSDSGLQSICKLVNMAVGLAGLG